LTSVAAAIFQNNFAREDEQSMYTCSKFDQTHTTFDKNEDYWKFHFGQW
jgi:hypothetical protein